MAIAGLSWRKTERTPTSHNSGIRGLVEHTAYELIYMNDNGFKPGRILGQCL